MTQEEHLESSHQTSNSVYDQVNDDTDKSKNIGASNQLNGARSNTTSGGIDAVDQTLASGDKDRRERDRDLSDLDKLNTEIIEVKSGDPDSNNLEMTVIKQQGGGENIRDIQTKIENSDKVPSSTNVSDDSEAIQKDSEKSKENESVNLNENKKKEFEDKINEDKVISTKCEKSNNNSETLGANGENEDPFARLKALKANISSVLREVKAVLSEHGEATNETEKEEIKPAESDTVRFRFVRRVRKKSIFDDEEGKKTDEPSEDIKANDTSGSQKEISSKPAVSNSCQEKKNLSEGSAVVPHPDHVKHTDQNDISGESTHITTKAEEPVSSNETRVVENLSRSNDLTAKCMIVENFTNKDQRITSNKIPLRRNSNEPSYQVKVVENKVSGEAIEVSEKTNIVSSQNKIQKENEQILNNINAGENQTAPVYKVKAIESEKLGEPIKKEEILLKQEVIPLKSSQEYTNATLNEAKESIKSSKTAQEKHVPPKIVIPHKNEPIYEIKVIESISTSEAPKETKDVSSTTMPTKTSKKEKNTSVEKPQVKVLKTKSTTNQTSQKKEKPEAKVKSEKNVSSSEKTKVKKTKTEGEIAKKVKRSSKDFSKSESFSQEDKPKSSNTANDSKSKIKKVVTATTEKIQTKENKDPKALVPTPSKDINTAPNKNLVLTPSENITLNTQVPLLENLESKVSKEIVPGAIKPVQIKEIAATIVKPTDTLNSKKDTIIKPQAEESKGKQDAMKGNPSALEKSLDRKSSTTSVDKSDLKQKICPIKLEKETDKAQSESSSKNNCSSITVVESLQNQQQTLSKIGDNTIKSIDPSAASTKTALEANVKEKEKALNHSNTIASTQQKSEPVSALEKVLATTNLKLASRSPPSTQLNLSKDQIIVAEKVALNDTDTIKSLSIKSPTVESDESDNCKDVIVQSLSNKIALNESNNIKNLSNKDRETDTNKSPSTKSPTVERDETKNCKNVVARPLSNKIEPTQKSNLLTVASTKDKTEIRRYSLPASIPNAISKLKTSSTSSIAGEKIELKPEANKISNRHASVEKEENNRDANVDISHKNDAKPSSVKKAVDKVKIPLKIESDKAGTVTAKPTLTLLPSPTKAVQLTPSKLELVPLSEPGQVLVKDIVTRKHKGLISSEANETDQPQPSLNDDNLQSSEEIQIAALKTEGEEGDKIGEEEIKEENEIDGDKKEISASESAVNEKEEKHEDTSTASKKRKMKKKVVIKRVRRRLSTDGVPGRQDSIEVAEPEICEKELKPVEAEPQLEPEPVPEEEIIPLGPKSCLKLREFQPGDIVLYNDRVKKVAKWKKATVMERITSISYKLNVEGEEKSCHICYIKKYTDKKVQFGGKEYLEIDYAQEDEEEEEEEEYNIWSRV